VYSAGSAFYVVSSLTVLDPCKFVHVELEIEGFLAEFFSSHTGTFLKCTQETSTQRVVSR